VLIKQQAEGPWQRALGAPEAVPAGGPTGALAAGAPSASGPAHRLRSSAAAGGGAGGVREACSYEPQQQHALSALTVTGERLGTGKCGGVLIGRCAYAVVGALRRLPLGTGSAAPCCRERPARSRFDPRALLPRSQHCCGRLRSMRAAEMALFLPSRLYGQLAAIKAMDLSKQGHLLPKLQAEVAIYGGTPFQTVAVLFDVRSCRVCCLTWSWTS
jgi:hypothetical protein